MKEDSEQPTHPDAEDVAAERAPRQLGRFRLLHELGRGGMGRVLAAHDPDLRRDVAIKILTSPEGRCERFVAEAQVTSQLEHPNIVPVHEMGALEGGATFFVMKKVEGQSLRQVLRTLAGGSPDAKRRWTRRRLLNAFVQIGQAVAYAHERGVLHRDLKPENVMLGRFGEVLVMDWGLARLIGEPEKARVRRIDRVALCETVDGVAIGTPGYMSPEQASGRLDELDARSDVWSLGAILYELLTWEPAYPQENAIARLRASVSGPPIEPRKRAEHLRIPDEIATTCMKALATERSYRQAGVSELVGDVEAFLEGSRRREEAAVRLDEARSHWRVAEALAAREHKVAAARTRLAERVPAWAPLDQPDKVALVRLTDELEDVREERARRFGRSIAAAERSLSHDPEFSEARELLAAAYWERYLEAERRRDRRDLGYYAERAIEHDPARYAPLLRGIGALTLDTCPAGAEVVCERFEQRSLVWTLRDRRLLGRTPLVKLAMEPGSYKLTLRRSGYRPAIYPLRIGRACHWDAGEPIPLLRTGANPAHCVYVPGGPFLSGGDPERSLDLTAVERPVPGFLISRYPVTVGEYLRFINDLHRRDPEQAWARVPRLDGEPAAGRYWSEPGARYRLPERDRDGDSWDRRYPVFGISWHDAMAYARWVASVTRSPYIVATELQREKATRGVDGRLYPWGDRFDPGLCKMQSSRHGTLRPEPVGAFPSDVSVYGVRDVAGSIREWSGDDRFDGDRRRRPVRGGSWASEAKTCRSDYRFGKRPQTVLSHIGMRLAVSEIQLLQSLPSQTGPGKSGRRRVS